MDILKILADELSITYNQVKSTVELIDADHTIPFIARYRKEVTGSLDDQVLRELNERLTYLRNLEKRKGEVTKSIDEQGKLTDELVAAIDSAKILSELEDIYRPYKQKRKTRASVARERGLEPLAKLILEQRADIVPLEQAKGYIDVEKGVDDEQAALAGASDIIAEDVSDSALIRKELKQLIYNYGKVVSKAVNPEVSTVYDMYYDYNEAVNKVVGHRVLAIDRGEREGALKVAIEIDSYLAVNFILNEYVINQTPSAEVVIAACRDSYDRLIFPSVEREIRNNLTQAAAISSVQVFKLNLKQLLMQPPVKGAVTMGVDPGFRTGCKIAVVDEYGKVLDTGVIHATLPNADTTRASTFIKGLIKKHAVTAIAIGNGTASREAESFIAGVIKEISRDSGKDDIAYMVVSEAGASVYSASKLAAEEFPDYDVSLRSAVSIARRLQDPLAELVKIDPKAIGVGQYQHDMPKALLDEALGGVVEDCVNAVGVDLNTASAPLLSQISGINSTVAKNIVTFREENGAFKNRKQLLKVAKLGPKAYTQCAGFLRVSGGDYLLDNTGVHPESYKAAEKLLKICDYSVEDLSTDNIKALKEKAQRIGVRTISEEIGVGEPTVVDIVNELIKPGRDPRDELPKPLLRSDVLSMDDLKKGMELKGTVRNVIDFGVFVDIGVHHDGLVHISQICNRFIKHPIEAVNVGDVVTVWVIDVDRVKNRISLTMKKPKDNETR